jgi:hypothetical protein
MVKMPAVAWFCDVLSSVELSTAIKECAEMQRNGGYNVSLIATCNFRAGLRGLGFCIPSLGGSTQNMIGSFSQSLRNWVFACAQFALYRLSEGTTQQAQQQVILGYFWFECVVLFNVTSDMFKQVFGILEDTQRSAKCWNLSLCCFSPKNQKPCS